MYHGNRVMSHQQALNHMQSRRRTSSVPYSLPWSIRSSAYSSLPWYPYPLDYPAVVPNPPGYAGKRGRIKLLPGSMRSVRRRRKRQAFAGMMIGCSREAFQNVNDNPRSCQGAMTCSSVQRRPSPVALAEASAQERDRHIIAWDSTGDPAHLVDSLCAAVKSVCLLTEAAANGLPGAVQELPEAQVAYNTIRSEISHATTS